MSNQFKQQTKAVGELLFLRYAFKRLSVGFNIHELTSICVALDPMP